MLLNRGMRLSSRARVAPLVLIVLAACVLAACGRSGYQYVENADDTVFVKIPDDWDVVSEGAVNFIVTPDDDIQGIPGEFVLAWRAEFNAAPTRLRGSPDYVQGFVEIQPVDRRMQSDLSLSVFFPELASTVEGVEVLRHDLVTIGDVSGHRVAWKRVIDDGSEFMGDRLVVTNSLKSVVYTVGVGCSIGCYDANVGSIDEIMGTFTVED